MQQPSNTAPALPSTASTILHTKLATLLPEIPSAIPFNGIRHGANKGALGSLEEILDSLLREVLDAFLDNFLLGLVDADLVAQAPVEVLEDFLEGQVGSFVEDDELEEVVVALDQFVDFVGDLPHFVDPGLLLRFVGGAREDLVGFVREVRELVLLAVLAVAFDGLEEAHCAGFARFLA